jgi:hypothetical protein
MEPSSIARVDPSCDRGGMGAPDVPESSSISPSSAASSSSSMSSSSSRIGAARVAWYATGRFYVSSGGMLQDAGYFLHLGGIRGGLFRELPGAAQAQAQAQAQNEATALFTFHAEPWCASSVDNGDLSLSLAPPGDFTLYYNEAAGADFGDPRTFARGVPIATFRRAEQVVTTTLSSGRTKLFGMNVFTADLVASRPFERGGVIYDLGVMLPGGVTQWGLAGEDPLPSPPPGVSAVVPFVGSAVAAARPGG